MDRCYVNNFKIPIAAPTRSTKRLANTFKKDVQAESISCAPHPQVSKENPSATERANRRAFSVREKELMDDFTRASPRPVCSGHMQVARSLYLKFSCLEGQMVPIEDISKMVHEGSSKLASPKRSNASTNIPQEFTVVYRKTLTLSANWPAS